MKNPIINQKQGMLENTKFVSDQSLDTKEKLVSEFIKTISDIEYKTCDEIENTLQIIVYKTRGLIHKNLR